MTKDLYIKRNGFWVDADTLGVSMGEDFINKLDEPLAFKDFVCDESRLINGKRYITSDAKFDSREVTLNFVVRSTDKSYEENLGAFRKLLYQARFDIAVPALKTEYHFVYTGKNASYNVDIARTIGTLAVGLIEPDPTDRDTITETTSTETTETTETSGTTNTSNTTRI